MSRHLLAFLVAGPLLGGCAAAALTEGGSLSSAAPLKTSHGVLTKSRQYIDKRALLAAKTARIVPTGVADRVKSSGLTREQIALVGNAIDRALCVDMSRRLKIVDNGQPADIVVHAVVTDIGKTDKIAAGASVVTSLGSRVASAATGLPLPSLRLPFGMGSLSTEAEIKDASGRQVAAMVWARGADSFMTKPRVAEEGDAHTLAASFAGDLAKLIVTGTDPIADPMPLAPTAQSVAEYFGAEAEQPACRQFGRHPGLGNTLGAAIGLPPSTTDGGARKP